MLITAQTNYTHKGNQGWPIFAASSGWGHELSNSVDITITIDKVPGARIKNNCCSMNVFLAMNFKTTYLLESVVKLIVFKERVNQEKRKANDIHTQN